MRRFHQGAIVRAARSATPRVVLNGHIAIDRKSQAWCYKEHVAGRFVTLARSEGWRDFMENFEPKWEPVDAYWASQIRPLFPTLNIHY